MSEGHFFALFICVIIGCFPVLVAYLNDGQVRSKKRWAWCIFWASPGLVNLWLKAILG